MTLTEAYLIYQHMAVYGSLLLLLTAKTWLKTLYNSIVDCYINVKLIYCMVSYTSNSIYGRIMCARLKCCMIAYIE